MSRYSLVRHCCIRNQARTCSTTKEKGPRQFALHTMTRGLALQVNRPASETHIDPPPQTSSCYLFNLQDLPHRDCKHLREMAQKTAGPALRAAAVKSAVRAALLNSSSRLFQFCSACHRPHERSGTMRFMWRTPSCRTQQHPFLTEPLRNTGHRASDEVDHAQEAM